MNTQNNIKIQRLLEKLPPFCKEYMFTDHEKSFKETTLMQHLFDVNSFLSFLSETVPRFLEREISSFTLDDLDSITKEEVQSFNKWSLKDHSYYTQKRRIISLTNFYEFYIKKGLLHQNYFITIHRPLMRNDEDTSSDYKLANYFIDCVKTGANLTKNKYTFHLKFRNRNMLLVLLCIKYGLKSKELIDLNMEDFDFDNQFFTIKRNNHDFQIFYDAEFLEYLNPYLEERVREYGVKDKSAFFLSISGGRMNLRSLQLLFKNYLTNAELSTYSMHILQDIYAKEWY